MYSSFHGAIGGAIMIAMPNPLGAVVAFASHFVVDYIGESSIGNTNRSVIIEGLLFAAYLLGAYWGGVFLLGAIGWVMANLPDLIDKPNRWFRGKKEWFSCHNGVGLFQYKGFKLGYPVKLKISKEQTLICNFFATIVWLLICIVK
jgi:hypothetical protein